MLDAPVPDTIDATLRPWVHYLPDSEPRDAGFQLTTGRFVRPVTAWDRTLLWAYKRRDRFKFQWLIEDDVAWEPRGALAGLIKVNGILLRCGNSSHANFFPFAAL